MSEVFKGATDDQVKGRLQATHDKHWPIVEALLGECKGPPIHTRTGSLLRGTTLDGEPGSPWLRFSLAWNLTTKSFKARPDRLVVWVIRPDGLKDHTVLTDVFLAVVRARWPEAGA